MKKFVIFDFDGTLADTNDVVMDSWKATYEHFLGYVPSDKEIIGTFGETLVDSVARTIPDEEYEVVRDYYRAYQAEHCEGRVHLFEGMQELLDELKGRGIKLGVATSRTDKSYNKYMNEMGIADYMDAAVTMEDVENFKPHPETAIRTLEKLGARPEDAIMLGDSKYDIGCSNGAGIESVLVGWSHPVDEEEMINEGYVPDHYIEKPSELLALIDQED